MSKALKYGIGKPITFSVPFLDNYINQYIKTFNTNFYFSPTFNGVVNLPNIIINGTMSVIVDGESQTIDTNKLFYLLNTTEHIF